MCFKFMYDEICEFRSTCDYNYCCVDRVLKVVMVFDSQFYKNLLYEWIYF